MEAPPQGGGAPLERIRPGGSESICFTRNDTLSTLVLPHTSSSAWAGCNGADVKSSHLYLYRAFSNTNCVKATAQY